MVFYAVFGPGGARTLSTWDDVLVLTNRVLKGWKYKKFFTRDSCMLTWLRARSGDRSLELSSVPHGLPEPDPSKTTESKSDGIIVDIFTDGGCKWNGTRLAAAGLGIIFVVGDKIVLDEPLAHPAIEGFPTNNTAETYAIEAACDLFLRRRAELWPGGVSKVRLWTDSKDALFALNRNEPEPLDLAAPLDRREILRARSIAWYAWRGLMKMFPGSSLGKVKGHQKMPDRIETFEDIKAMGNNLSDQSATRGIALWEAGRGSHRSM